MIWLNVIWILDLIVFEWNSVDNSAYEGMVKHFIDAMVKVTLAAHLNQRQCLWSIVSFVEYFGLLSD